MDFISIIPMKKNACIAANPRMAMDASRLLPENTSMEAAAENVNIAVK